MKTIEELYKEVMASEELKKEFLTLKPEEVEGFAKKNGCEATFADINAFLEEKAKAEGELSDDELDQVAGGKSVDGMEVTISIATLGFGCAAGAIFSAAAGNAGTAIEGEGMLCDVTME